MRKENYLLHGNFGGVFKAKKEDLVEDLITVDNIHSFTKWLLSICPGPGPGLRGRGVT